MAILKKLTMYVCDLEDNLSTDTLNEMIDTYVLNRINTNGFCLLKEEKSKEVEWSDDYPLNHCDKSDNPNEWEKCLNNEVRNLSQETANCDKFTITAEEVEIVKSALLFWGQEIYAKIHYLESYGKKHPELSKTDETIDKILNRIKQWQDEHNK